MDPRSQTQAPMLGAAGAHAARQDPLASIRIDARADRAAGVQYDPRWYGAD